MNITLDLRVGGGELGLYRLRDAIDRIGPDDGLTLIVDPTNAEGTDKFVEELTHHGFDYQPKGSEGQAYNIIATRHLVQ